MKLSLMSKLRIRGKENKRLSNKLRIRTVICVFIVGMVVGTISSVVYAAQAFSVAKAYGPILGYRYQNQGEVKNDSGDFSYVGGYAHVGNPAGTSVPTGYMGAKTKLYYNGSLCAVNDWYYNETSNTVSMRIPVGGNCGNGNYTANGSTRAYNGNGYDEFTINTTPAIRNY